jgi:tetratricopeptide (TPR) repeat protein
VNGETPETLKGVWLDVGIYRVEVTVDEEGNVTDVYPMYGNSLLTESALAAAVNWRFPPQRINGRPARVVSAVNVEFQNLDDKRKRGLLTAAKQELERQPGLAASYYNVGFAYQFDHQYKEASEYFQKAIEKSPNWPVAYTALGDAYRVLDQYDKALDCFLRAAKLKNDYYEAYERCGLVYTRLRRDADALSVFIQAANVAKSVRDKLWAFRNLVTTYESLGQKKAAAEAQMQVAKNAVRYCAVTQRSAIDASKEAYVAAAKYNRVDDEKGATAAYRLAMDADPLSEAGLLARIMLVGLLRKSSQIEQATALLQEMIQLTDEAIRDYAANKNEYGLGSAYYWRGNAHRDLGQLQMAVQDLKKAIKHRPDWGEAHLRLAYTYLKLGDIESARREYHSSGIVDPDLARSLAKRMEDQ